MDRGKFLLAARRYRNGAHTEYIISLDADDFSQGSNAYIGKLRSVFLSGCETSLRGVVFTFHCYLRFKFIFILYTSKLVNCFKWLQEQQKMVNFSGFDIEVSCSKK